MVDNAMISDSWLMIAGAWIGTYMLHSTLLLLGVFAITSGMSHSRGQLKETLWKLALVGGFVTATIQISSGHEPWSGRIDLLDSTVSEETRPSRKTAGATPAVDRSSLPDGTMEALPTGESDFSETMVSSETATSSEVTVSSEVTASLTGTDHPPAGRQTDWKRLLASTVLAALLVGLGFIVLDRTRLFRRFSGRNIVTDDSVRNVLDGLRLRAGLRRPVKLTWTKRIRIPVALGFFRPEICLPRRALTDLNPSEQTSMLAHELAHLKRHDPAWLGLAHCIERLFFFQPLNRIARRRLQEIAEYSCDGWAARQVGEPLILARCLTEVAEWASLPPLRAACPAPAVMVANRSALARRVTRLLEDNASTETELSPSLRLFCTAALLTGITLAAPGISAAGRPKTEIRPEESAAWQGLDSGATSIGPVAGAPSPLPIPESFEALQKELHSLEQEAASLYEAMDISPHRNNWADLLPLLEQEIADLRRRRDSAKALVDEILNDPGSVPFVSATEHSMEEQP